eukprot:192120_1
MSSMPWVSHQALKNPFSARDAGLVIIHKGNLIIRGDKESQKSGYTMTRYCVLVFDNASKAGFILCFKTTKHYQIFHQTHRDLFVSDMSVDWKAIQTDSGLDTIIALKDARIDNNMLSDEKKETFTKKSNEILIQRTAPRANGLSLTNDSLNGHYLIIEENEYDEWIAHMQRMATVEQRAIRFRKWLESISKESETVETGDEQNCMLMPVDTPVRGQYRWRQMILQLLPVAVGLVRVGYWAYGSEKEHSDHYRLCVVGYRAHHSSFMHSVIKQNL